jgi:hypothetical protein
MSEWAAPGLTTRVVATDPTGKEHTLYVSPRRGVSRELGDPESIYRGGRSEIVTEDDRPVNPLGGGKFQVVDSGLILESHDPEALMFGP